jgi:hypothetical protein
VQKEPKPFFRGGLEAHKCVNNDFLDKARRISDAFKYLFLHGGVEEGFVVIIIWLSTRTVWS